MSTGTVMLKKQAELLESKESLMGTIKVKTNLKSKSDIRIIRETGEKIWVILRANGWEALVEPASVAHIRIR